MQDYIKQLKRKFNSPELFEEIVSFLKYAAIRPFEENRTGLSKEKSFLISHCLRVGAILAKMNCSKETVISGILFQLEEKDLPLRNISQSQKEEVLMIVSKAKRLRETYGYLKNLKVKPINQWYKALLDQQVENLRRAFFILTKDLRPILVLIADKLDELIHLINHYPKDQQKKQAIIALEIMSPLCYGLGMEEIKGQFEDLAFPVLYPKEYQWLMENLKDNYEKTSSYTERIRPLLEKILKDKKIKVLETSSRAKRYFSLYQKLLKHGMDISKVYDLVALRVIVEDVEDCYQALGAIHNVFKLLPGRIKDYINSPKKNGYRALHTTVIGPENTIIEIQIKTVEMSQEAAFGIAAHLSYKGKFASKTYKHQFFWLEQLRKWKTETPNIEKLSDRLKSDLFKNRIFVLTPKGDVIDLPKGATPIDFAFAIHSNIGEHAEGAKVNGKIVHLDYALKDNDKVEIIVNKNKAPSSKWLTFVKTAKAKDKINKFLEKTYGAPPPSPAKAALSSISEKVALIKKIIPPQLQFPKKPKILIAGEKDIAVKIGKCCNPKSGDQIEAFITQGEGASVHKIDCPNLLELKEKWPEKIVPASWAKSN